MAGPSFGAELRQGSRMRRAHILPAALTAILLASTGGAQAQNFFERLFGLTPSRPAPPPVTYQNVPPPQPGAGFPGEDEPKRPVAPSAQARPTALRVPTEDGVVGRELKQNGSSGSLRIERTARSDLRARITLVGRRSATSVETCSVTIGGSEGVTLTSQGRPDGLSRYQADDPTCPLQVSILDESVLVKGPDNACMFQAANCLVDPAGLWGPDPSQLMQKAREYESTRASADKAVRDNYRVMAQRARPESVRSIVAEQAAFSADREVLCRSYAREGAHSFCDARYSEGRAIALAQRLGITVASNTAPTPADNRGNRRRPDPYGVPPTDDLVQRAPSDDD